MNIAIATSPSPQFEPPTPGGALRYPIPAKDEIWVRTVLGGREQRLKIVRVDPFAERIVFAVRESNGRCVRSLPAIHYMRGDRGLRPITAPATDVAPTAPKSATRLRAAPEKPMPSMRVKLPALMSKGERRQLIERCIELDKRGMSTEQICEQLLAEGMPCNQAVVREIIIASVTA